MFIDERVLSRVEKKLGRTPMDAARPFVANISIGRERTMIVIGGEFTAVDPAAFVIEGRLNERRSKLAFIERGMRVLVKTVEPNVPAFHDFLGDTGVKIIGTLGTDG